MAITKLENLNTLLANLIERYKKLVSVFDFPKMKREIDQLRQKMSAPDFWQDASLAAQISQRAENLNKDWERWQKLEQELKYLQELAGLLKNEFDADLSQEFVEKLQNFNQDLNELEIIALYQGSYDDRAAIMTISAGTGGVDAQDWAQILERMYLRFAERQNMKTEIIDRVVANEAGLKNVMIKFSGLRVYGNLKSENGTHRLLRNSPFNADGLRQTSFASVEVIPDIPAREIDVREEDVRIDVFRSSGPGGQSVNTTDSAVRLVHLPTGITVSCQSERSQHQNKENAFAILRAKLAKLELEKKEAEEKKLKGEVKADWGQQIRSYWLYGNRLVKDHRTDFSNTNVEAVLDGDLQGFIAAYLRWLK